MLFHDGLYIRVVPHANDYIGRGGQNLEALKSPSRPVDESGGVYDQGSGRWQTSFGIFHHVLNPFRHEREPARGTDRADEEKPLGGHAPRRRGGGGERPGYRAGRTGVFLADVRVDERRGASGVEQSAEEAPAVGAFPAVARPDHQHSAWFPPFERPEGIFP